MKCHFTLFYKDKEPLPSDWYVSIQPVVFSPGPASCLEGGKSSLTSCCRGAFLCAPICKWNFQLQRSFPISYEAKNSCWSRASKIKALVYSTSFIYNGKDMRGALCVCSLVNQMLELLDRIRIGRFTSSGKEMAHAHRLLRKRDYSIFIIRGMLYW